MVSRTTILVVEDDPEIRRLLVEIFEHRFMVVTASDAESALREFREQQPDLILLDLILPDRDGFDVLQRIRQSDRKVGVIILSARRSTTAHVRCLNGGADDYVDKPFDLDDLETRVDTVLRRCKHALREDQPEPPKERFDTLTVTMSREPTVSGKLLHLTPVEHKIARTLVARADELVPLHDIGMAVFGQDDAAIRNTLWSHMGRLRAKLRQFPDAPVLYTLYGHGYGLSAHSSDVP